MESFNQSLKRIPFSRRSFNVFEEKMNHLAFLFERTNFFLFISIIMNDVRSNSMRQHKSGFV